jgi:solute carrier family 13 (sodium-dependent dicarboxylate transporter), member 2/3/5
VSSTEQSVRAAPLIERVHRIPASRRIIYALITIAVPVGFWLLPLPLAINSRHALAVASFMIIAWITEVLPHALTGLAGCYLFWVLKIVDFETAFSGFADQTPWFLFGAALIGMMASKSGLARRLAYMVMQRVGTSYSRLLLGMILSSFLLTLLVPSGIACVVIMAAVAVGLIEVFGLPRGSNVGRGIFVTLTYTAGIFDKMVVAGASSILGRGLIQKVTGIEVYWSQWLLAFLPCVIVTVFVIWRLVVWLYPPEKEALEGGDEFLRDSLKKMGAWTPMEKHALLLMSLAIALWATDLIHHISPAVIGIGVGLLAGVPGLGILELEDLKRLNYLPVFFTATAISMGEVLLKTNALNSMTTVLFAWMRPWVTNVFSLAFVPYWTAFVYHIFLGNELSMLATSVPPLMNFAKTAGIHLLPLGLVWAFAAGGKVFVYQSGVLVAGYSYGYFDAKDVLRVGFVLTVVQSAVLLLIVPFYWPLLGIR